MAKLIRGKDPESDYTFDILKQFRSDRVDDQNTMDLMAIVWRRSGRPVLEKRRVWHGKKGGTKLKKLVGMNSDDIQYIIDHQEEIVSLLK
jgi:hypothetical protein